jgi:uncharacterized protein YbjT (DUF2867 family)
MTDHRPQAHQLAVVAGASGLVGRELVLRLIRQPDYSQVVALTRRPLGIDNARLSEVPARFESLEAALSSAVSEPVRLDAYCCLGTTIRTAGSEAAFRTVDHDYVVAFGQWAARHRAHRLVVVSALGADTRSSVFYNRVKGETEIALRELAPSSLVILRPSLLDGDRRERRLGESFALALARPLRAVLPAAFRPVRADDVAQSMIDAALTDSASGTIESAAMHGAAARADTGARA